MSEEDVYEPTPEELEMDKLLKNLVDVVNEIGKKTRQITCDPATITTKIVGNFTTDTINGINPEDIALKTDLVEPTEHTHKTTDISRDYITQEIVTNENGEVIVNEVVNTVSLDDELDGKANVQHTHTISEITDYTEPDLSSYALKTEIPDISTKADVDHTHPTINNQSITTQSINVTNLNGFQLALNRQLKQNEGHRFQVRDTKNAANFAIWRNPDNTYAAYIKLHNKPAQVSIGEDNVDLIGSTCNVTGTLSAPSFILNGNDMQTIIDSKADVGHKHTISEITDYTEPDLSSYALKTEIPDISTKSDVGHTHTISDITDFEAPTVDISNLAPKVHTHSISDVTDLQTTMDGKSNVGHKHLVADVDVPLNVTTIKFNDLQFTQSGMGATITFADLGKPILNTANSNIGYFEIRWRHPGLYSWFIAKVDIKTDTEGKPFANMITNGADGAEASIKAHVTSVYLVELTSTSLTFGFTKEGVSTVAVISSIPTVQVSVFDGINSLEDVLNKKANSDHTHTISEITDYTEPDLSNLAPKAHTHSISEITDYEPIDTSQFALKSEILKPEYFDGDSSIYKGTGYRCDYGFRVLDHNNKGKSDNICFEYVAAESDGGLFLSYCNASLNGYRWEYTYDSLENQWVLRLKTNFCSTQYMFYQKYLRIYSGYITADNIKKDNETRLAACEEKIETKANSSHTHSISDVTNLQTTLNGKANSSHTHPYSQISDFAAMKIEILKAVYPVGAIYTSMTSTSPSSLFGFGTWVQITDRFLYCANSSGTYGGEKEHTLTANELPSIASNINITNYRDAWCKEAKNCTVTQTGDGVERRFCETGGNWFRPRDIRFSFGSDQPHNNMPPYMTVYAWRRTA